MNTIFRFLLTIFLLQVGILQAQQLVVYPACDSVPHNDDFTVKVRLEGGKWQDLYEYQAEVDMHSRSKASMVYFDFKGKVEVSVTSNKGKIETARIRPLSYQIQPKIKGKTLTFTLNEPRNVSVEINGDMFHNLHVFSNLPETNVPNPKDTSVIYFGAGFHNLKGKVINVSSNKTVYIAGGAVVKGKISCINAKNVRICGRGILYPVGTNTMDVNYSDQVQVEDIIVLNPRYNTLTCGQSKNVTIKNIRSFSSQGWSDGIDLFCSENVLIEGVFMRNSDDCIAIYGHRWKFYGNSNNITIRNSTLWADVAHPILIGTHGDDEKGEIHENITFSNIDILNQHEMQLDYQGCMSINASDKNLVRNVRFEDIRIEDIEQGQLVNLRVTFNKKYCKAAGRGIENIYFKNVSYTGKNAGISIIQGYDETRMIKNVTFENLSINGVLIDKDAKGKYYRSLADVANFFIGTHVEGVEFITTK